MVEPEPNKPPQALLVAKELYDIFVLEALTSPHLQKIIEHALNAKAIEDTYREAWISGITWSIIHAQNIEENMKKLQEKQNPTSN